MRNARWLRLLAYVTGSVNQELVRSKYSCGALVVFEHAAESMMALNPATLPALLVAPIWEE
jgi:hypothetical protein